MWGQSSGTLPLSFFHMPLQEWLRRNATAERVVMHQRLSWKIYFPFLCWNLWLARNEQIFKNQSRSQHGLVHIMIQAATNFFFLATLERPIQVRTPTLVRWNAPLEPYVKLNTDGSIIGNTGMASVRGLLRDSSGFWISGFSLKMGIVTNNIAKSEVVRQGLLLA